MTLAGRNRGLVMAVLTGLFGRGMASLTMFVTTPMTIHYLGKDGFGLMATITSVVAWMLIANVGVGLGLQNALTAAIAAGKRDEVRSLISTATAMVLGICLLLAIAGGACFGLIDWLAVFNAKNSPFAESVPALILISGIGVLSTMAYGLVSAYFAAKQQLHVFNLLGGVCQLLVVLLVVLAIRLDLGIIGIGLANVLGLCLGSWLIAVGYLKWKDHESDWVPRRAHVSRESFSRIWRSAKGFFVLQACCLLLFQMDLFIINRWVGAAEVTPYFVAQRFFAIAATMFSLILAPMWPAYGHALALREFDWIKKAHRNLIRALGATLAGMALFLYFVGDGFFTIWVGKAAAPTSALLLALFVYFALKQWSDIHAILINGLDKIGAQAVSASIHAVATLLAYALLVGKYGSIGIALGGALGYALVSAWVLPLLAKSALAKLQSSPAHA